MKGVVYEELAELQAWHTTQPLSIVRAASAKAQLIHNHQVEQVETEEVSADEMWSFVQKNRSNVSPRN